VALAATDAAKFSAGSIIAVDADYAGQTGFVGSPISGAYVRQALADVDYIRRVTFNVALVSQVTTSGLTLANPLPGGAPGVSSKLQAVTGFVDREGGAVCPRGQPGRTNLLSLSTTADFLRRGGNHDADGRQTQDRPGTRSVECSIAGAASRRQPGWRESSLLPELLTLGNGFGLDDSSKQACREHPLALFKTLAQTRAMSRATSATYYVRECR